MDYRGIIITGTSGSGKTTIAKKLQGRLVDAKCVKAVTTREKRPKDVEGEYDYINSEEYERLKEGGSLLTEDFYRSHHYGIKKEEYEKTLKGNVPILIITPKSATELNNGFSKESGLLPFFTIFLDAPDKTLEERVIERDGEEHESTQRQREKDREHSKEALYHIRNEDEEMTIELIVQLWDYRNRSGILPGRLIKLMVECGMLIPNGRSDSVSYASYDLSLGDWYTTEGDIKSLSAEKGSVEVLPYDCAIVQSKETVNMPRNMSGRFDLRVGLFCKGILLSNGPQVDPGFRGPLFCLLFNASDQTIFLPRNKHYATIEFHKLMDQAIPYTGNYQDDQCQSENKIMEYLGGKGLKGSGTEIRNAMKRLREESEEVRKKAEDLEQKIKETEDERAKRETHIWITILVGMLGFMLGIITLIVIMLK